MEYVAWKKKRVYIYTTRNIPFAVGKRSRGWPKLFSVFVFFSPVSFDAIAIKTRKYRDRLEEGSREGRGE